MQEWLYRASDAKAGADATRALADEFGFVCRNAFADAEQPKLIANVANVRFADIIHLYFVDADGGRSLGAFRVVGPNRHPNAEHFGAAVPKTTLRRVAAGSLRDRLQDLPGYEADPRIGAYCGWPVVREERSSPSFVRELFPGRSALVPR